jgi:hypothetical protein
MGVRGQCLSITPTSENVTSQNHHQPENEHRKPHLTSSQTTYEKCGLSVDDLKIVERTLRRLAHPEVPESFWDAAEEMEDGVGVDMATALTQQPPAQVLERPQH